MHDIILTPGAVPLADWRAIYRGAGLRLSPDCAPRIAASCAGLSRSTRCWRTPRRCVGYACSTRCTPKGVTAA